MNPIEILIRLSGKEQKEIAEIVGVAAQTISAIKKNHRDLPLSKFIEWCKLLNVDVVEVFTEYKRLKK